jgi:hypothetical protein
MKNTKHGGAGPAGVRLKDERGEWTRDEHGASYYGPDPKGGFVYFVYKLFSPPLPPLKTRKVDMTTYFSSSSSLLPFSSS